MLILLINYLQKVFQEEANPAILLRQTNLLVSVGNIYYDHRKHYIFDINKDINQKLINYGDPKVASAQQFIFLLDYDNWTIDLSSVEKYLQKVKKGKEKKYSEKDFDPLKDLNDYRFYQKGNRGIESLYFFY